jgi:hypothetical protein
MVNISKNKEIDHLNKGKPLTPMCIHFSSAEIYPGGTNMKILLSLFKRNPMEWNANSASPIVKQVSEQCIQLQYIQSLLHTHTVKF